MQRIINQCYRFGVGFDRGINSNSHFCSAVLNLLHIILHCRRNELCYCINISSEDFIALAHLTPTLPMDTSNGWEFLYFLSQKSKKPTINILARNVVPCVRVFHVLRTTWSYFHLFFCTIWWNKKGIVLYVFKGVLSTSFVYDGLSRKEKT